MFAGGGSVQALGHGAYQRVQAETSSPGEVIVLLYDALLKNLRRAAAAIEAGDSELVNEALTRARASRSSCARAWTPTPRSRSSSRRSTPTPSGAWWRPM